jgi:LuxR family transcriptional regulator, maltose regulon positive regulatory protein
VKANRQATATLQSRGAIARRPPPRPRDVVERPRLHALLDEALSTPLTLVAAPAGFGKTTLLLSWVAAQPDTNVAWLSGDAVDDGPGFWTQVLESLVGEDSPASDAPFDSVVGILEQSAEPIVLVVDDFHHVRSKAALEPLAQLVSHPPSNAHIVLATRRDPKLPLHRLRLAGQLTEVRAKDLAFAPDEASAFFTAAGLELRPELVGTLLSRTEGWAAALRFAAISLRNRGKAESFVLSLARTEQAVADYLVAEVLGSQPPRIRDFLLSTSICDRVDGALADDLTGRTDGARTLAGLEHDNVFLELEPDGRWYRYHSLFAALLRVEAERMETSRFRELHSRAAHRLAADGDRLAALRHALTAGDAEHAGVLVSELWIEIDGRGDDRLAAAILDRIDSTAVGSHPHLCLLAAWERLRHDDPVQADAWLKAADAGRRSLDKDDRAAYDFGRCVVELRRARRRGDLAAVERALERLARPQVRSRRAHDDEGRRALILCSRGAAAAWRGELDGALTTLEAAVDAARRARLGALEVEASSMLALVCAFRGELTRAARLARPLLAESEEAQDRRPENVAGLLALTRCSVDWDDLQEARDLAELARQIAENVGDRVGRAAARVLSLQAVAYTPGGNDVARLELAALELDGDSEHIPALLIPTVEACRVRLAHSAGAAGPTFEAPADAGPEYSVALARTALAEDDVSAACDHLDSVLELPGAPKATRVEAAVLRSIAAERRESDDEAHRWIELALDVAEPDAIRRPFTDAGPEVGWILRRAIRQGTAHRWLAGSLLAVLDGREVAEGHAARELLEPLSARETVVLRYLPTLLSNQEIAGELFVSVNTVKTHLKSIYRKLGVSDRREAVRLARELRLVG